MEDFLITDRQGGRRTKAAQEQSELEYKRDQTKLLIVNLDGFLAPIRIFLFVLKQKQKLLMQFATFTMIPLHQTTSTPTIQTGVLLTAS